MDMAQLSKAITALVKQEFPEIGSVFRYDMKAKVISTKPNQGVATIHPLRPDGTLDTESPEIPDVPLPVLPSHTGPTYIVPDNNTLVRFCYYYDDPSQPKIVECLGSGYIWGDMQWHNKARGEILLTGVMLDFNPNA